jgi:hypothetical protein
MSADIASTLSTIPAINYRWCYCYRRLTIACRCFVITSNKIIAGVMEWMKIQDKA